MQDHALPGSSTALSELLDRFDAYADVRLQFLSQLKQDSSCRDPLAEFSEVLVAELLRATPARSRVQKGYDLIRPGGEFVQVKYLANPQTGWINWHHVQFADGVEECALVVFVAMQLKAVFLFSRKTIAETCRLLGKRHPNQDVSLQITKRNYETMLAEPAKFQSLGIGIFDFRNRASR